MLQDHLSILADELNIPMPSLDDKNQATFVVADTPITIQEKTPGFFITTEMTKTPQTRKEEIFIKLMQANLLGQGTGGGVIGIDKQEKNLTLSLAISYEMNYQMFKETIEDFVNYSMYWQQEVEHLQEETRL
jgi:hypothetical protein